VGGKDRLTAGMKRFQGYSRPWLWRPRGMHGRGTHRADGEWATSCSLLLCCPAAPDRHRQGRWWWQAGW